MAARIILLTDNANYVNLQLKIKNLFKCQGIHPQRFLEYVCLQNKQNILFIKEVVI